RAQIPLRIEIDRTRQVFHLNRLHERAARRVDDEAILFTIADPDVAVGRIDGEAMDHADLSLPDAVAVPLIDDPAGLIEVDDARRADGVRRIARVGVVGALVRVLLGDVDVAGTRGRHVERLPEEPLSL